MNGFVREPQTVAAAATTDPLDHDADLTVSIVFPTFNRCAVVAETLRRFAVQDYPFDRFEVIVCDNSSDATPDMVSEFSAGAPFRVVLIHNDERLPAVKRNQGLAVATGDIVVFLNDDVWVNETFVRSHVDAHLRQTRPAAVLGNVHQSTAMEQTPFIRWYEPFAYHLIADRAGQTVSYWYSWSMNLSFRRSVLLARNLWFHEDWAHIGHEDIELGYRWTQAGYDIVYEPAATGEHFHPHTLESACRLQTSIGKGLRDLEVLIPEPGVLEHYGVYRGSASPRARVRGAIRRTLFNDRTVPPLVRWLNRRDPDSKALQWTYWKLMLWHTERGYAEEPLRSPVPLAVNPA